MKKLYTLLLTGIVLFSCEGPPGPVGPRGFDGLDGLDGLNGEEGFVFEYQFSFTAPDYGELLVLPEDFNMLESDVMLVYFLWEIDEGVEIWRPLQQTLYIDEGIVSYNFDFTRFDASVFMDGTVNLDNLGADFTDNWIARVVVVPAQFGDRSTLDYSDYDAVKEFYNLSPSRLATENNVKRPN